MFAKVDDIILAKLTVSMRSSVLYKEKDAVKEKVKQDNADAKVQAKSAKVAAKVAKASTKKQGETRVSSTCSAR